MCNCVTSLHQYTKEIVSMIGWGEGTDFRAWGSRVSRTKDCASLGTYSKQMKVAKCRSPKHQPQNDFWNLPQAPSLGPCSSASWWKFKARSSMPARDNTLRQTLVKDIAKAYCPPKSSWRRLPYLPTTALPFSCWRTASAARYRQSDIWKNERQRCNRHVLHLNTDVATPRVEIETWQSALLMVTSQGTFNKPFSCCAFFYITENNNRSRLKKWLLYHLGPPSWLQWHRWPDFGTGRKQMPSYSSW